MLKLMYITNDPQVALIAENAGVDRIFVDLETVGKQERQGGMNTVQSRHTIADVKAIRGVLSKSELLVRTNPIYSGSQQEIESLIAAGADVLMLPYFQTAQQVKMFLNYVNGRARTMLLVETPESIENLDDILRLNADEYLIGLNDLHLGYGMKFMFQLVADGTVERICEKFAHTGKPYGFGGIARVGSGMLPAEKIIGEHVRLGSSRVILSRSFCNTDIMTNYSDIRQVFDSEVPKVRNAEADFRNATVDMLNHNHKKVQQIVEQIVRK